MPRRNRPPQRFIEPDVKYNSELVARFANRVMRHGKKSTAYRIMYDAFDMIEERTKKPPLDVFEQAVKNVTPMLEVRPRRVGGATYQIPMEVRPARKEALAIRWLIKAARARSEHRMEDRLASELIAASKNEGTAIKKREEVHKMAEANRAFAHFRW